ncbi:hypothetical protein [Gaopeijia maritima]|uniref:Small multi-drug export protein n=1 Tax=Gaopeijia maritima TaxID=3119007 RepID=A0ABU9E7P5_9BACT
MWEIIGALLVGCVVSGVVPLVNAELLVVAAAVAVPPAALPLVVAASTVGQMISKTLLFSLARWAPTRLPDRATARLDRAVEAVRDRGGAAGSLMFVSALVGLPPFYGLSLAAGVLGMPLALFLATGTAGRAVRFAALAWAAHFLGVGTAEMMAAGTVVDLLPGH